MQQSDRAYADDARRFKINGAITSARKAKDRAEAYSLLSSADVIEALTDLEDDATFTGVTNEMEIVSTEKKCSTQVKRILRDVRSARTQKRRDGSANKSRLSEYPEGIKDEMLTGRFTLSDAGVTVKETDKQGVESVSCVCYHPIMPIKIMQNVEDGSHRVVLAYYKRGWKYLTVKRSTIASRQSIVQLSEFGIDVTSESAGKLVEFLSVCEAQNAELIPHVKSVAHLGWVHKTEEKEDGDESQRKEVDEESQPTIGDKFEFAPFYGAVKYGGEDSYKDLFDAVSTSGDYEKWRECATKTREKGGPPKIALAASFAAPIIRILGGLCFCVHIWGSTGYGKTVSLLQSASVWGDPAEGKFMRSLSGTMTGLESTAAFICNLPLCLNEQQSAKEWADLSAAIYMLCEGQSKPRGRKDGGLRKSESWSTIMITNGEMPLTSTNSGAGAINRVVSVECNGALYDDPVYVADTVRTNYGFAGREFIGNLLDMNADKLRARYKDCCRRIGECADVTDKQRLSAGYILLADELATEWIFKDGQGLAPSDIAFKLATNDDVSSFWRAYDLVVGWIASNGAHFVESDDMNFELYGKPRSENDDYMCIIAQKLSAMLTKEGYSYKSFLADADANGLLFSIGGKRTATVKFDGKVVRCAILNVKHDRENEDEPF